MTHDLPLVKVRGGEVIDELELGQGLCRSLKVGSVGEKGVVVIG
jgi:hypothetical protein